MELQKILEYQTIDLKIFKMQKDLRNSLAGQNFNKASKLRTSVLEDLQKCVRESDEVLVMVDRFRMTYDKIANEMIDLDDALDTFDEAKVIDQYEKKIDQYKKELVSIERELSKLSKKLDDYTKSSEESLIKLKKCEQVMIVSKKEIEKAKAAMMGEVKGYMSKLQELEKEIPADILTRYKDIKKLGKMPVFVPAAPDCKSCSGCGMEISNNETTALEAGKLVDCPNCNRILYKK